MVHKLQADLYQIREALVCCYLLIEEGEVCLIDTGFTQGIKRIQLALHQQGLDWTSISTILLTHGHLDHTYNLSKIQRMSLARSYAHPRDADHIAARHPYRGLSRLCGFLEFCGRALFGYTPPKNSFELKDNQIIPFGKGIRVLHTPGHTAGHCCFHWEKHNLIFTGDLFATGRRRTFLPPAFLNSCPEHFPKSLKRILDLNPNGMLSNHCDKASETVQRVRFEKLAKMRATL